MTPVPREAHLPLWIHHVLSCAWVTFFSLTHLVSRAVLWLSMNVFGLLGRLD